MTKLDSNAQNLEKAINKLLSDIHEGDPDSQTMINQVTFVDTLFKCKETDAKAKAAKRRISGDVLANVGASLAGIAMIVGHERAAVVTSKALQFVKTLR